MFDILILNNCSCNKPIMLHCLWYILCLYISYVHYSYPSFFSPFLPFPSYPASPLLLPFICLVTVTCLRLFSRIFGSNDRHIFFGPSVEHKFPASSIDHYVYYTFCLFFLCLSKAIGRFQFWDCLLLNPPWHEASWCSNMKFYEFFDPTFPSFSTDCVYIGVRPCHFWWQKHGLVLTCQSSQGT